MAAGSRRGPQYPSPGQGCQELAGENAPAAYQMGQERFENFFKRGASQQGGVGGQAN